MNATKGVSIPVKASTVACPDSVREASADLGVCSTYETMAESACAPDVGAGGAFDTCSPGGSTGVDQNLTYIASLICGT